VSAHVVRSPIVGGRVLLPAVHTSTGPTTSPAIKPTGGDVAGPIGEALDTALSAVELPTLCAMPIICCVRIVAGDSYLRVALRCSAAERGFFPL
jgi:hypothetical protein